MHLTPAVRHAGCLRTPIASSLGQMIADVRHEDMISVIYLSIVSALCVGMGLFLLWKRITLFCKANRAVGYFVRWEERGLRKIHFYPVVRFQAMDGNEYEFVGAPGTSTKNEKKQYSVLYPSDMPHSAMIHSFMAYWLAPMVFFILSAGAAAAALQTMK